VKKCLVEMELDLGELKEEVGDALEEEDFTGEGF
jgi:hypothetical protein